MSAFGKKLFSNTVKNSDTRLKNCKNYKKNLALRSLRNNCSNFHQKMVFFRGLPSIGCVPPNWY